MVGREERASGAEGEPRRLIFLEDARGGKGPEESVQGGSVRSRGPSQRLGIGGPIPSEDVRDSQPTAETWR